MNHYYDETIDDCPIHEDKDTDYFFTLELSVPIGLDKPHPNWKASANWAYKLLESINPNLNNDETKVLQYRMKIGHTGIYDDKTCVKYLLEHSHNDEL